MKKTNAFLFQRRGSVPALAQTLHPEQPKPWLVDEETSVKVDA